MRQIFGILALPLFIAIGCGGESTLTNSDTTAESDLATETESETQPETDEALTPQSLTTKYAGATFVSVDTLEIGQTASGSLAMGNWTVGFTTDTVTWNHSDVVEVGTYRLDENSNAVASISGRDLIFSGDGTSLNWDSRTYRRLTPPLFDSQQSLQAYFNNSTYDSVEELEIGENAQGGLAMGHWMAKFDGNEFTWYTQDTVEVATYAYANGSSFTVNFFNRDMIVYVLSGDQLLIDSRVYQKASTGEFSSQETLVAYLNNSSYQSAELLDIGATSSGIVAVGHWHLNFVGDTFTWTYSDIQEAGNTSYVSPNNFIAVLPDRELTVRIDRGDIIWDDVRYKKAQ